MKRDGRSISTVLVDSHRVVVRAVRSDSVHRAVRPESLEQRRQVRVVERVQRASAGADVANSPKARTCSVLRRSWSSAHGLIGTRPHSFEGCNDHVRGALPPSRGASRVDRSLAIPTTSTTCATHACTAHDARACHMRRESGTSLAVARRAHCLLDPPDLYELATASLQSIEWENVIGGRRPVIS
jgi:hypothetical protein